MVNTIKCGAVEYGAQMSADHPKVICVQSNFYHLYSSPHKLVNNEEVGTCAPVLLLLAWFTVRPLLVFEVNRGSELLRYSRGGICYTWRTWTTKYQWVYRVGPSYCQVNIEPAVRGTGLPRGERQEGEEVLGRDWSFSPVDPACEHQVSSQESRRAPRQRLMPVGMRCWYASRTPGLTVPTQNRINSQ